MKKILAAAVLTLTFSIAAGAQGQDIRYRDIKDLYDPKGYVYDFSDPYSPAWSGVASFLIPGLGQCLSNEWGRGLAIFGANVGFSLLEYFEASVFVYGLLASTPNPVTGILPGSMVAGTTAMAASAGAAIATIAGQLAFNIWGICDAVNVAKVKNLCWRDSKYTSLDMSLSPSLALVPSATGSFSPAPGLSLRIGF